jgi:CRP/FNR family transcriptional regulator, cyclic AMP receptor protein
MQTLSLFPEPASPLHQFLVGQPWFGPLPAAWRDRVLRECTTFTADQGSVALPAGQPTQGWYAVLHGLVKLQSTSRNGRAAAFLGAPAGEWFGEGTALKAECRRYEVVALRDSLLLCLPLPLFDGLRAEQLAFNQFMVAHLNRRLGQAMAGIEAGRIRSPEQRVALFISGLFWKNARRLDLSQEEIGQLSGLSRQTVNRALQKLEAMGLVALQFSRVRITDEAGLCAFLSQPDGGTA